jgi:hypothetical protein
MKKGWPLSFRHRRTSIFFLRVWPSPQDEPNGLTVGNRWEWWAGSFPKIPYVSHQQVYINMYINMYINIYIYSIPIQLDSKHKSTYIQHEWMNPANFSPISPVCFPAPDVFLFLREKWSTCQTLESPCNILRVEKSHVFAQLQVEYPQLDRSSMNYKSLTIPGMHI